MFAGRVEDYQKASGWNDYADHIREQNVKLQAEPEELIFYMVSGSGIPEAQEMTVANTGNVPVTLTHDGEFGPDDAITREQLVTILYRYAQGKGYDVSVGEDTNILSYTDTQEVSEYAISAMQWACGAGIIEGVTESTLVPQGNSTRAQVATMLMRFCEEYGIR